MADAMAFQDVLHGSGVLESERGARQPLRADEASREPSAAPHTYPARAKVRVQGSSAARQLRCANARARRQ